MVSLYHDVLCSTNVGSVMAVVMSYLYVCSAIFNLILDTLQKCSLFYGLKHELTQNCILHCKHLNFVLICLFSMVQT